MQRCVEIRVYNLKPGAGAEFHRLMHDTGVPLQLRHGVDVVSYRASPHDPDSYCLIRAYNDLADHSRSQESFYASADWRDGPRSAVLALIENHASVVIELPEHAIDALRATAPTEEHA